MKLAVFSMCRVASWAVLVTAFMSGLILSGCEGTQSSAASAEQVAQDQKRFMQQVNTCFLEEYAAIEKFSQPVKQVAVELRAQCADEFSALRAAKLNYAMVRDVVEPPPRMVEFEVAMAQVFIESARLRAQGLFKNHPKARAAKSPQNPVDIF